MLKVNLTSLEWCAFNVCPILAMLENAILYKLVKRHMLHYIRKSRNFEVAFGSPHQCCFNNATLRAYVTSFEFK